MTAMSEVERPVAGYVVPFRVERGFGSTLVIWYDGRTASGQPMPTPLPQMENPVDAQQRLRNLLYTPLQQHVWDLMQAYHCSAERVKGALKERDDAIAAKVAAEGKVAEVEKLLASEKARTAELRRQKGKADA